MKRVLRRGLFRVQEGWFAAAWTAKGLSALALPQVSKGAALRKLAEYLPPMPSSFWASPLAKVPGAIRREAVKALFGRKARFASFDLFFLTPFQQRILEATCRIPAGQVRSYGWAAAKAGSPGGGRAAGQALNRNPIPLLIPCHRITASGNGLGGYGGGIGWKIRLLEREGVKVVQGSGKGYRVVLP